MEVKAEECFDTAEVILLVMDRHQKVSAINQTGCDILGYSREEIIDKNWFDNFLPEKNREQIK